jgi:hypothetical protein
MGWFPKIGGWLSREDFSRIAPLTAHPENAHPKPTDQCVQVSGQIFGDTSEIKLSTPDGFASQARAIALHRYSRDACHRA